MRKQPISTKRQTCTALVFTSSKTKTVDQVQQQDNPTYTFDAVYHLLNKTRWLLSRCFFHHHHYVYTHHRQHHGHLHAHQHYGHLHAHHHHYVHAYEHSAHLHAHYDHLHNHSYHTHASCPPLLCKKAFGVSQNNEALLQSFCQEGRLDTALDVLMRMDNPPSIASYLAVLRECNKKRSLNHVKQVHTHLAQSTAEITGLLGDYLVMALANCGAVEDACLVSTSLPCLTVFSWTAIISAYVDHGCGRQALKMYQCMQESSVEPNSFTFVSLFRACGSIPDLIKGKELHRDVGLKGFGSDLFVGTALLSMYSKCGAILEAEEAFTSFSKLDVVSWNAMLSAYVEQGHGEKALLLYRQIQVEGVGINQLTILATLQACSVLANKKDSCVENQSNESMSLEIGRSLHAEAQHKGYTSDCFVGSALVSMYSTCGNILEAAHLFCNLFHKDTVSWNAMLSAYVEWGHGEKALQLYTQIQKEGISSNQLTYVIVLQACGTLVEKEDAFNAEGTVTKDMYLEIGHALHISACAKGYTSDVRVGTALVNLYNKCGSMSELSATFCALAQRDTVAWNAMLTALVEHGQEKRALQLYRQMGEEGVDTNELTFVITLQACSGLSEIEESVILKERSIKATSLDIGQALHSDARRKGYASDVLVGNTLLSMYCRSGAIQEAEDVFHTLSQHDTVSWNVMLAAYIEHGQEEVVLRMFEKLQADHISLDDVTLNCVLQACFELGNLYTLRRLHFDIICAGFEKVLSVASNLIRAYGGCACMVDSLANLDMLPAPDLVSWNTCIVGHAGEGDYVASLQVMETLKLTGFRPDVVSFSSLLVACTRSGRVVEGLQYFESMSRVYSITPDMTNYGNIIDLFGRAGDFKRIENLLERMPAQFDLSKFVCMLGASRIHNNIALARWAFDQAVDLQPNQAAVYVLMSNICADFELQETAFESI